MERRASESPEAPASAPRTSAPRPRAATTRAEKRRCAVGGRRAAPAGPRPGSCTAPVLHGGPGPDRRSGRPARGGRCRPACPGSPWETVNTRDRVHAAATFGGVSSRPERGCPVRCHGSRPMASQHVTLRPHARGGQTVRGDGNTAAHLLPRRRLDRTGVTRIAGGDDGPVAGIDGERGRQREDQLRIVRRPDVDHHRATRAARVHGPPRLGEPLVLVGEHVVVHREPPRQVLGGGSGRWAPTLGTRVPLVADGDMADVPRQGMVRDVTAVAPEDR